MVIYAHHARELILDGIVELIGKAVYRAAYCNITGVHLCLVDQLSYQGKDHLRSVKALVETAGQLTASVNVVSAMENDKIKLDHNLFTGLITDVALAFALVKMPKHRIPRGGIISLVCQLL